MSEEKSNKKEIKEEEKIMAALSYLWLLCLLPLLTKRNSKFILFHAKQGLVLFFLSLLTWVPGLGQILALVLIVVSVLGFVKAYNGEWWKIPFVYEWSKKVNI